jgi:peptidoglycan/xylan/chitin deacetylase (PgdA/CDA1 family)
VESGRRRTSTSLILVVALTFDDGPNEFATPAILDALAERCVAATFFVFGSRAGAHPELIGRMLDAGHGVQPHCWAGHDSHHQLDRAALEDDIARTLAALESLGCPTPTIWRPPNGDIKDPQSYQVAAAHHVQLVTWTLQTCDWNDAYSVDRILGEIDTEAREDAILRPDSVVLMHDTAKTQHLLVGLIDRIEHRGLQAGLLSPDSSATAQGGNYRFGRQDGELPCGM